MKLRNINSWRHMKAKRNQIMDEKWEKYVLTFGKPPACYSGFCPLLMWLFKFANFSNQFNIFESTMWSLDEHFASVFYKKKKFLGRLLSTTVFVCRTCASRHIIKSSKSQGMLFLPIHNIWWCFESTETSTAWKTLPRPDISLCAVMNGFVCLHYVRY